MLLVINILELSQTEYIYTSTISFFDLTFKFKIFKCVAIKDQVYVHCVS